MSIVFTGDIILDRGVDDEIKLHGDSILVNSLRRNAESDFLVVNYEGTFTESDNPQNNLYNFKTDKRRALLLKQGGVTHVSVANNHSFDFGKQGFESTLNAISENGLTPLGESCKPAILGKGSNSCAVLSASLTSNNDSLCISSAEHLKKSVNVFREDNPSIPLVLYIHWGMELQPQPEQWQRDLAKELVESGVNAIIGHHSHMVQSIEFIDGSPIFYNIGNFVADAYLPNTAVSYTVSITVNRKIQAISIKPVNLETYFPQAVDANEQLNLVKKYLLYSNGVCAIQTSSGWLVMPDSNVNFKEDSDLWVTSCNGIYAVVKKLKSGSFLLSVHESVSNSNIIKLHGELNEIQISDINNDGIVDIMLGLTKKVKFDQTLKKRLNIYSYQQGNLQALWLGTKFIHELKAFDVTRLDNFNYLTTLEVDVNGKRFSGVYEWDDFGFALTKLNQIE